MSTQRDEQGNRDDAEETQVTGAEASAQDDELDLDDLDLSVETVEERISPSETNVFDK
ncbi:MAG: hypothetical protein AAF957_00010 [Planctomycetota bacterium]